jgi:hypothetical protein
MSYAHNGGLIPADGLELYTGGPLRAGADVSWLPKCRVGDNQGNEGACALFAIANWAEIMHGREITDRQCLALYAATLKDLGRGDGGLTFSEAFKAAAGAGWLPGRRGIQRVPNLTRLASQPLLGGYTINAAFDNVSDTTGCLDHTAGGSASRGLHAVAIVAHGSVDISDKGPWVYIENSWGVRWGWNGIGVMSEDLHRQICREVWCIV